MNGEKLVELLAEHQVGIKRQPHDLFELEKRTNPRPRKISRQIR
jgi:hypothetical protein